MISKRRFEGVGQPKRGLEFFPCSFRQSVRCRYATASIENGKFAPGFWEEFSLRCIAKISRRLTLGDLQKLFDINRRRRNAIAR
jgi:hypothetical protein